MIISTTHTIEGKKITKYIGIVTGVTILGANILRDFLAGIRDIVGGRAVAYEKEIRKAKDMAIKDLTDSGKSHGADAIVGVSVDYETISDSMMMVIATGTAVKLGKK